RGRTCSRQWSRRLVEKNASASVLMNQPRRTQRTRRLNPDLPPPSSESSVVDATSTPLTLTHNDGPDVPPLQHSVERRQISGHHRVEIAGFSRHLIVERFLDLELLISRCEVAELQRVGEVRQLLQQLTRHPQSVLAAAGGRH